MLSPGHVTHDKKDKLEIIWLISLSYLSRNQLGILETLDPDLCFWMSKHWTGLALKSKTHKKVHTEID